MKKLLHVVKWSFILLVIAWIAFAQLNFRMSVSDASAQKDFSKSGVELHFQTFQKQGAAIHYAITGQTDQPTLLFIHGSPGSWTAFEKYLKDKELNQHFRLISIDRPGFGDSNFGHAMNMERQSAVVGPLIRNFQNGKKLYLIGHSLGGPLVVKLAADSLNLVSGIVLLAGSVDPEEETPEQWRHWLTHFPISLFVPKVLRTSNTELMDFKTDVLAMPGDLEKILCPALIIQGLKDGIVPPANAFYAQKHLTHSCKVELVTMQNENHFIPWTKFTEIKNNIINFAD